jgi:phosphatidylglycerol:prolipoprotein diacylglycerol transferase
MSSVNPWGIDPVLLNLGPLQVRWYGLMYVCGFVLGGWILGRLSDKKFFKLSRDQIDKFVTMLIIGMFLGARFFYVFIYNWDHYSQNIGKIFSVWEGGLSFHGAIFGMCMVAIYVARKNKIHWFELTDSMVMAGAPGIFFGRMGNFINGELYGRITDSSIGMIFPNGGPYPRHASQLYEGFMEGLLLFAILWFLHKRVKIHGAVSAFFLMGYGVFRYIVEFFREADAQLGYYFGGTTTMGQILCFIMILIGVGLFLYAKKLNIPNPLYETKEGNEVTA